MTAFAAGMLDAIGDLGVVFALLTEMVGFVLKLRPFDISYRPMKLTG
jgi:hypothetical protein